MSKVAVSRIPGLNLRRGWPERLGHLAGGFSVRTKILGIVIALTTVLGLAITWQVRSVMNWILIGELEIRGSSVVSDLAARSLDPILLNDTFALYQLLTHTVDNHPDAVYAFVMDEEGQVLAHTFGETGFPMALLELKRASLTPLRPILYQSNTGRVHDFAMPILEGRQTMVRLGMSEGRLHGVVNRVTGQMLLTTLAVALIGMAAAIALTWLLTQPILDLMQTAQAIGQGSLHLRAPHWADDEIGALADAFNQMTTDLEANRQTIAEKEALRGRLLEQLITAQEEERKRIARELHDGVGQSIASLILDINMGRRSGESLEQQNQREGLHQTTTGILKQVRLLSRQLRPSVLDDLGLAAALQRYAQEHAIQYPQVTVDLHCDLPDRLAQSLEITLYRVVQEAMTNAARHSGGNTISVLLSRREERVQAIVEDNGHGFDVIATQQAGSSMGLHSMVERMQLLGGNLEIESSSEGTTVFVEAPLI